MIPSPRKHLQGVGGMDLVRLQCRQLPSYIPVPTTVPRKTYSSGFGGIYACEPNSNKTLGRTNSVVMHEPRMIHSSERDKTARATRSAERQQ